MPLPPSRPLESACRVFWITPYDGRSGVSVLIVIDRSSKRTDTIIACVSPSFIQLTSARILAARWRQCCWSLTGLAALHLIASLFSSPHFCLRQRKSLTEVTSPSASNACIQPNLSGTRANASARPSMASSSKCSTAFVASALRWIVRVRVRRSAW
jgi:hypothetical protein